MIIKTLRILLLLFFSTLWFLGCSPDILRQLNKAGVIPDDYRYGDLYRVSNLPEFKERQEICPKEFTADAPKLPVNLYLIGDSFTDEERIGKQDFVAQNYTRVHWAHTKKIALDRTKKNVLIIQTVERHFRDHFAQAVRNLEVTTPTGLAAPPKNIGFWKSFNQIFPVNTEEVLESFLFGNDFAFQFKEIKATLNQSIFGRTNDLVSFSKDKKYILLNLDTDSTRIYSSFTKLYDNEVDSLIMELDRTQKHYLAAGFDEVILSIVPNKATILAQNDGEYNHLIERIQTNKNLSIDFIGVYDAFVNSKSKLYLKGDSHWNCAGQRIWINKVNQKLKKKSRT